MIGSRTALVVDYLSLGVLYESTIYWWIDCVEVCEDYAFFEYGQHGNRGWVFEKTKPFPQVSHVWDNMTWFPDMVFLVRSFYYILLNAMKNNFDV